MDRRMDGWMKGWIDKWINGLMDTGLIVKQNIIQRWLDGWKLIKSAASKWKKPLSPDWLHSKKLEQLIKKVPIWSSKLYSLKNINRKLMLVFSFKHSLCEHRIRFDTSFIWFMFTLCDIWHEAKTVPKPVFEANRSQILC